MVDGHAPTNEDDGEQHLRDTGADDLAVMFISLVHAGCNDGSETWPDDVDEQNHKTHWWLNFRRCVFVVAHLNNY